MIKVTIIFNLMIIVIYFNLFFIVIRGNSWLFIVYLLWFLVIHGYLIVYLEFSFYSVNEVFRYSWDGWGARSKEQGAR